MPLCIIEIPLLISRGRTTTKITPGITVIGITARRGDLILNKPPHHVEQPLGILERFPDPDTVHVERDVDHRQDENDLDDKYHPRDHAAPQVVGDAQRDVDDDERRDQRGQVARRRGGDEVRQDRGHVVEDRSDRGWEERVDVVVVDCRDVGEGLWEVRRGGGEGGRCHFFVVFLTGWDLLMGAGLSLLEMPAEVP